ncbi:hypothetical protein, partial [Agrobacterium cavarae]|uniref:hypothetical protein n=1 Tax=Agrobacterium cavarae TaxID=2528239 RepID=UPI0028B1FC4F
VVSMDLIRFATFIKWQKCSAIFANQPVISGFSDIMKHLNGIELSTHKILSQTHLRAASSY